MSSSNDLSKPHKTRTDRVRGRLVDPPETYGRWAYWWGATEPRDSGWHNAPRPEKK